MENTFILAVDFEKDLNCKDCIGRRGTLGHCLCAKSVNYDIAFGVYRLARKISHREEKLIIIAQPGVYDCLIYLGVEESCNAEVLLVDCREEGDFAFLRECYDIIYDRCKYGPGSIYPVGQYYHMKRVSRQAERFFTNKVRLEDSYLSKKFDAVSPTFYQRNIFLWYLRELPYRITLRRTSEL